MVRKTYQSINDTYRQIKTHACSQQSQSVMILVAAEIDAMASARMLTQLLRADNIVYGMQPVSTYEHVSVEILRFPASIRTVFLINCGASWNIPKLFQLSEKDVEYRIYVLDNHRPFHLANIYSRSVNVFCDEIELEDVIPVEGDGADLSPVEDEDEDEDSLDEFIDEGDEEAEFDEDEERENIDEESDGEEGEEGEDEVDVEEDAEAEGEGEALPDSTAESAPAQSIKIERLDTEISPIADEQSSLLPADATDAQRENMGGDASSSNAKQLRKKQRFDEGHGPEDGYSGDDDDAGDEADEVLDDIGETSNFDETDAIIVPVVEDDDNEEAHFHGKKRKRVDPVKVRKGVLQDYYNQLHHYYGSTAYLMLNLVLGRTGSHIQLDNLWQAILGITDLYHRQHLSEEHYNYFCNAIRMQLGEHLEHGGERGRYMVTDANIGESGQALQVSVQGAQTGHITEGPEFRFFLYRHWSLYDSMCYSPYVAAKLGVWQAQGSGKLKELLAKVGVPLQQCKQSYTFMLPTMRDHLWHRLRKTEITQNFNLQQPEITTKAFFRYNSYKNRVPALDVVIAAQALVETYDVLSPTQAEGGENSLNGATVVGLQGTVSRHAAFAEAYDLLGMKSETLLKRGIDSAISIQKMVVNRARVMLEGSDAMTRMRNVYWAKVNATSRESHGAKETLLTKGNASPFERPMVLTRLGQYIMDVRQNLPRKDGGWVDATSKQNFLLPLLVSYESESRNAAIVVGISPLHQTLGGLTNLSELPGKAERLQEHCKFKQLFDFAAKELGVVGKHVSFDTCVVEIGREDVGVFVQTLDLLLTNQVRAKEEAALRER